MAITAGISAPQAEFKVQDMTAEVLQPAPASTPSRPWSCALPVDTYRSDDRVTLDVDLPHVDPASISVDTLGHVLQIVARRPRAGADEARPALVVRRLFLAQELTPEEIRQHYDGWVLRVSICPKEPAR